MSNLKHIVIIGAGSGGISVASRLVRQDLKVSIIDPKEKHYYQPLFTLVGGGASTLKETSEEMAKVIPKGTQHIKKKVQSIVPNENYVLLDDGTKVAYDYLIASPGIQIDWGKIDNLRILLDQGKVHTNYHEKYVEKTFEAFKKFKGGNAIFTFPNSPVKCGGAPQKIMWLFQHYIEQNGLKDKTNIYFTSAAKNLFGVEKYRTPLERLAKKRKIHELYEHNLIALTDKVAKYEILGTDKTKELKFDFIHVTPPMSAPDFLEDSGLCDKNGWLDVDPYTLRSKSFDNVFALGDASNLPTAKTGAGIRKQAPVVCKNLAASLQNKKLSARYNGYTSCPLVTGYGRLILAEFGYDGQILETFPFDQAKERYSMYLLKKYLLPKIYWRGMLRGRM